MTWHRGIAAASVAALLVLGAAAPARAERSERGEALYRRALTELDRGGIDHRRQAIQALEQATLLDPDNPRYALTLARAYYEAGFLSNARKRFEHVTELAPGDPEARYGQGQVWRRDWLKYLDRGSLALAVDHLSNAARLDPKQCDVWLMLVPLLVEQHELKAAQNAARRAHEADPARADADLAYAYTSYRLGEVMRADSLFESAEPRLHESVRLRMHDIAPVASARDTFELHRLSRPDQERFIQRFWKENDPDPTSPENEARLEYWSRVAHAYFLFYDPHRREWDERGEVYVRYGPPSKAEYNPLGVPLYWSFGVGVAFPTNVLVWHYPELGMEVTMQDRLLSEYYMLPIQRTFDPDPQPDPDSLAARTDALATRGGRGVFPVLPPGVRPLPVEGALARFEAAQSPRLLAQIEAPGGPADSLWAQWVVVDAEQKEVRRGGRNLTASACDVTELRNADFAADLPAGTYTVGLSVRDQKGRRGVFRSEVALDSIPPALSLSDLVVACGAARPAVGPGVRIEPNPGARVKGDEALTAYFEIYHLRPGSDGQSRFEYVYTVRSAERDPRIWIQRLLAPRPAIPEIEATREEEQTSTMRRQFVTVPVDDLPPGRYKLEVRVRDLVGGLEAVREALFVKG